MGNRIDKLITSDNTEVYAFPFSKVWLAINDKDSQGEKASQPVLANEADPHKSHQKVSQCIEHLLENIPIPADCPQDTFRALMRKELEDQLIFFKAEEEGQPSSHVIVNDNQDLASAVEVPPGQVRIKSSPYETRMQLFRSIPLITARVHLTNFEVTNEMITACWCYFRQTSKECLKKYGPIANSAHVVLNEQQSKFYYQGSFNCLFDLFVDFDSPDREKEYYALHFIHPNGYEFHISRIRKHQIEANPHNLCVLTLPSKVNYERGPKLAKILQKVMTPNPGNCTYNPETDHALFVTIQGTQHDTDYDLWDLSKGKKSRAEQLPPVDSDKCRFCMFVHNQT